MKRPANTAGPYRGTASAEPIVPNYVYSIAKLHDWGFGARSVAALQRAGLKTLRFGARKFFRGSDLIAALERGGSVADG